MRAVDRSSDRPVFRQIADALRDEINAGNLPPGSRLPSESDLMTRYDAARETVRRAVAVVKAEGLVDTQHGRGAFVRLAPTPQRLTAADARGEVTETVSVTKEKSDALVAAALGLRSGTSVVRRERLHFVGHDVVERSVSYIPWRIASGSAIAEQDPMPGGIYARLADDGHPVARFTEDVTARMPTPDEARVLRLPDGAPVLTIARVAHDADDQPIELVQSVLAANRFVLTYDVTTSGAKPT